MKIAFLTEIPFKGKITSTHLNMRTEFAWMYALDADHYNINEYKIVNNYDNVFIILPKGILNLNAVGSKIANNKNTSSEILSLSIVKTLKNNNQKVHYIQEGPSWLFNEYEIIDQFNFYNNLAECDSIFAHNEYDTNFYKGLFPNKNINVIPTLLIEDLIENIQPKTEDKVIIGGNFARWYGGFQSYIVADEFKIPIWTQESHAKREHEELVPNLYHLPRLNWFEWMKQLSTFKYAVHLMPTIAAGTFSLNCAYFGIPCIGNKHVDTQRLCHPELSVDVEDTNQARKLCQRLSTDNKFYSDCVETAKINYKKYYNIQKWKNKITKLL